MGNVIKPMWAECPALTRLVLAGYPTLGLALTVLGAAAHVRVGSALECSLQTVVGDLSVWTLFVSGFYHQLVGGMSFLMLLFELYMGMMYFPRRERELGSAMFAIWLLLANAATNVIFLASMAVLCAAWSPRFYFASNAGLWPLITLVMSQHLLGDPHGSTNFWGLVNVPNKWYPLFFVGMFSLLNGVILWPFFAAVAVGYAAFRYPVLSLDRLLPLRTRVDALEQRCLSRNQGCLGGTWLNASGAVSALSESSSRGQPAAQVWGVQLQTRTAAGGSGQFAAFSGKGNRLGDGSETYAPPLRNEAARGAPTSVAAAAALVPSMDEEHGEMARLVGAEGAAGAGGNSL